jgi:hypothetical protein
VSIGKDILLTPEQAVILECDLCMGHRDIKYGSDPETYYRTLNGEDYTDDDHTQDMSNMINRILMGLHFGRFDKEKA